MSDVLTLLSEWMPRQRWYVGGSTTPELELIGSYELEPVESDAALRLITVALVRDHSRKPAPLYQVPLVIRDVDAQVDALGFIGPIREHGDRAALVDGTHDQAFAHALIRLIADEKEASGAVGADGVPRVRVYGQPMPGAKAGRFVTSRVLSGEQSNTSIICELQDENGDAAVPLIVKLFRTLHAGDNPDVTLQTALAATGSLHVPPTFGQVSAVWPDADGKQVAGHLAFAQEFFVGVEDAWRVALRAAEGGEDFTPLARALGRATAEVHATLRRVMPTVEPEQADIDLATQQMWRRYELAAEAVPELREYATEVERVYALASDAKWPTLQRIHGDFHLGQVLAVPDRGWVLLDFEGEPLRPLESRNAPDVPARDVAGLLRSFDYVAGSLTLQAGHEVARDWADAAREAFLEGYVDEVVAERDTSGTPGRAIREEDERRVLEAYELDKAIYETLYESEFRPTWLPIPLAAVRRILGAESPEAQDADRAEDESPEGEA
ncbi:maltokinase N-terminal cap-like domain-containing protein [Gulosibacter molinativorax]|uniref:maltokinase N-terminal cap-like domain-containing protein n=1 Tax=Gulosibacter molinativorax TaxID=256821 RepID=UPI0004192EAF|nr:phosphotransferase [Gulosibacter molinativorax]QUY63028.1 Maltokinase [Gulosibacter molinativorax]